MAFGYKVGSQVHTLSGFGLQAVWDAPLINILPNGTTDVYLVINGSLSLDVDFRAYDDSTDTGSMGVVSINPSLVLPDGSSARGWHHTFDRTLHNAVVINRVTPVVGTYTYDLWVAGTGTPGYCEYGTRIKPGQQEVLILDEAALAAATALVPAIAFLSVPFGALVGLTAVPGLFCAGPPPDFPVFDDNDFILGGHFPSGSYLPKLLQAWIAAMWNTYCECKPPAGGGLLPAPPIVLPTPPPSTTLPTPPPPIVCDPGDPCRQFNSITNYLQTINNTLQNVYNDNRLTINQTFAINYNVEPPSTGLSGSGSLAVADTLGLAVSVTTVPPGLSSDMDPSVPSYVTLGHINLGTPDGWVHKRAITHEQFLILGIPPSVTLVEYSLEPGVVATISSLTRSA